MAGEFDPDSYLKGEVKPDDNQGFDPDSYLAASRAPAETSSPVSEAKDTANQAIGAGVGGSLGYGTGKALSYVGGKVIEKGAPLIGALSPEQMDYISKNADAYRAAEPWEKLLEEYRTRAENVRKLGYDAAEEAKKHLVGDIPTHDYYKTLAQTASNPRYSAEMAPGVISEELNKTIAPVKEQHRKITNANEQIDLKIEGLKKQLQTVDPGSDAEQFLQNQIDDLRQVKQSGLSELDQKSRAAVQKAKQNVERMTNVPREIAQHAPDLDSRIFDPELSKALEKATARGRGTETLEAKRVGEGILPALRDKADFDKTGGQSFTDKFNTDLSEGVRDYLGQKFPEYDELMKKSSKAIDTQKSLQKLGIQVDKNTGELFFSKGGRDKLTKVLLRPDQYKDEVKLLKDTFGSMQDLDLLHQPGSLGQINKTLDHNDLIKQMEVSALKDEVTNLRKGVSSFDINNLTKPERAPGLIAKLGGTKLQELLALNKESKLGKAAKLGGSALPGLLGAGGALLGAASAASAGELSPMEATAAGIGEAFNPLPGTDVIEGAVQAKKAYQETGSPLEALKSGAKGFVSPVPALAQSIGENLDKGGLQASNEARARMEQNLRAFESLKPRKEQDNRQEFKNYVEQKPEELQRLSNLVGTFKGGEAFQAPLQKVAKAEDPQTKAALMMGLKQQPAFQEILKRIQNEDEEI